MAIELGGSVFEITHDLVGDLFRAKNAGVTISKYIPPRSTLTLATTWWFRRCSFKFGLQFVTNFSSK
jgi:hypothetical protein